jgi:hypothetical protein
MSLLLRLKLSAFPTGIPTGCCFLFQQKIFCLENQMVSAIIKVALLFCILHNFCFVHNEAICFSDQNSDWISDAVLFSNKNSVRKSRWLQLIFKLLYFFVYFTSAHCSYLDIYISQNISLCKGDFEGQFQTSL